MSLLITLSRYFWWVTPLRHFFCKLIHFSRVCNTLKWNYFQRNPPWFKCGSEFSILGQCGSGSGSSLLMSKNWREKNPSWKKSFLDQNHFKYEITSLFPIFVGHFGLPDPDPADQNQADPCRSGFAKLKKLFVSDSYVISRASIMNCSSDTVCVRHRAQKIRFVFLEYLEYNFKAP